MSFSLKTFLGKVEEVVDHDFTEGVDLASISEREKEVINDVSDALKDLAAKIGGHISISSYGHLNPVASPGDVVTVNVAAVPDPAGPTQAPVVQPSAVPVDTPDNTPVSPLTTSPLQSPSPDGNPAPVSDAGLTQPSVVSTDPAEVQAAQEVTAPVISSSGPDLGPSAVEADTTVSDAAAALPPATMNQTEGEATTPEEAAANALTGQDPSTTASTDPATDVTTTDDPVAISATGDPVAGVVSDPAPDPVVDPTELTNSNTVEPDPAVVPGAPATADPNAASWATPWATPAADVPDVAAPAAAPAGTMADPTTSDPAPLLPDASDAAVQTAAEGSVTPAPVDPTVAVVDPAAPVDPAL